MANDLLQILDIKARAFPVTSEIEHSVLAACVHGLFTATGKLSRLSDQPNLPASNQAAAVEHLAELCLFAAIMAAHQGSNIQTAVSRAIALLDQYGNEFIPSP